HGPRQVLDLTLVRTRPFSRHSSVMRPIWFRRFSRLPFTCLVIPSEWRASVYKPFSPRRNLPSGISKAARLVLFSRESPLIPTCRWTPRQRPLLACCWECLDMWAGGLWRRGGLNVYTTSWLVI